MTPVSPAQGPFPRIRLLGALLALTVAAGCDSEREPGAGHPPVAIERGDECHVCGMIIVDYPGPKGEAYTRTTGERALKFCSTRDLFAFILEPDTAPHVEEIYVHDMGETAWDHPADSALIPARSAWYVLGHGRRGAMGPTLASFASRRAAEAFARERGGRVLGFDAIDLEVLASMSPPRDAGPRPPGNLP